MSEGVTHVVLAEWAGDESAAVDTAELARLIDTHLARIAGVVAIDHGPSVSPEGLEGGFDWGMVVTFADTAARDAYLPHPEHAPVAEFLRAHARRVVVFDLLSSAGTSLD